LKSIDYNQYQNQLEEFCRYLFEYVFDDMNTNSILKFDIENSIFKLLPCLLTSMFIINQLIFNYFLIYINRLR